mmetsp:Transcript_580/g.896  ORF Transcript_580/g.896 Transcript_580/m.896 type:complete len:288 (-) Transcript_580:104-967(-)
MLARLLVKKTLKFRRDICRNKVLFSSEEKCKKSKYPLPKAFFVGSFAGFLGSLAGMGGGFVMIPLMTSRLLRLSQHQAHGTSLFAVAATGIAGALGYSGQVDLEAAATIAVCGMFTAKLGASFTTKLSENVLKRALGVYMVAIAPVIPAKDYFIKNKAKQTEKSPQTLVERIAPSAVIGLGSGFLAGLFGVGGGAVVVPALTLATDMNHYEALGTSLCAMTLPAIVGTATHFSKNNIALRIAPSLAIGSFLGAYVGSKVGLDVDEDILRYGFSTLMLALGFKTLLKG